MQRIYTITNNHLSSLAAICVGVSPFVSIKYFKFMAKNISNIPPKKKKTGYGLPTASRI